MEIYLDHVDPLIHTAIRNSGLNSFWARCLNTAILGFTDKRDVPKLNKILNMDNVLPAWGLTAKVNTGNRGGRVLRPFQGKLFIDVEGHLRWERPESLINN